jgi:hypothetical protein
MPIRADAVRSSQLPGWQLGLDQGLGFLASCDYCRADRGRRESDLSDLHGDRMDENGTHVSYVPSLRGSGSGAGPGVTLVHGEAMTQDLDLKRLYTRIFSDLPWPAPLPRPEEVRFCWNYRFETTSTDAIRAYLDKAESASQAPSAAPIGRASCWTFLRGSGAWSRDGRWPWCSGC